MLDKKGFTLVELLGVFAILGIISLVTFPYATGMLKKTKEGEIERFENDIFLATEAYINANEEEMFFFKTNKKEQYISTKRLIDSGFISKNIVDPTTKNKLYELDYSVKVTKNGNDLTYILEKENYSTGIYGNYLNNILVWYDGYMPLKTTPNYQLQDLSVYKRDAILSTGAANKNTSTGESGFIKFGTDAYATIGNSFSFRNCDDVTIIARYKLNEYQYGYLPVLSTETQLNGRLFFGIHVYIPNNTDAIVYNYAMNTYNYPTYDNWFYNPPTGFSTPINIIATVYRGYVGTATEDKIFVNGIKQGLIKDAEGETTPIPWADSPVTIARAFENKVDIHPDANITLYSLIIVDGAMTDEQIKQITKALDQRW